MVGYRARTFICAGMFMVALVATHVPPPKRHIPLLVHDKTLHVIGFAVLGALVAWRRAANPANLTGSAAARWYCGLLLYAAADELTQPLTGRSCELYDWMADATGGAMGTLLVFFWYRRKDRNG